MTRRALNLLRTTFAVARDFASLTSLAMRSRAQLAAENLFLRKQLALYMERRAKPHRADDATRIILVGLSHVLDWRHLLMVVKPETLIRWHRKGFQLLWRWKSRAPGRPPIPTDLQQFIATIAAANRTWGEERMAGELLVKFGIHVSPRTVRRHIPPRPPRARRGTQAWSTFVRNHARSVLASDFFVIVTATFRVIYAFVVLEVGSRRILHWNVTEHPTADWTAQQFRMIVPGDQPHRFVIHDRDTIYSEGVDRTLKAMGLAVFKTPARVPQANTFCERLIATIRRECLDFLIPMTERHLRAILREWIRHYNRGRPHSSLGPGLPEPPRDRVVGSNGHQLPRRSSSRRDADFGRPPSRIPSRGGRVSAPFEIFAEDRGLVTVSGEKSFIENTGQVRKIYGGAWTVGGLGLLIGLLMKLMVSNEAWAQPLVVTILLLLMIAVHVGIWLCVTVRCPNCGAKVLWLAISRQPMGRWMAWLISQARCPVCRFEPVAGRK